MANATKSVNEVTVMLAPALASALELRPTRLSSSSDARGTPSLSLSKALAITNASSRPTERWIVRTQDVRICKRFSTNNPLKPGLTAEEDKGEDAVDRSVQQPEE